MPKKVFQLAENHIEFEPALPEDRIKAIQNIPYNYSIARIYFEFNQRFWMSKAHNTAITVSDHPSVLIEDHTDHIDSKSAILEVHAAGKMGEFIQANHPIESAKKELNYIWGETISDNLSANPPICYFWNNAFYQKGAYPYLGVGQAYYPGLISKNLPSLSFAGDYTEIDSPASMNGVIKSAYRAIKEIKAELATRQISENKKTSSTYPYSFWLKSAACVGLAAAGVAAGIILYKKNNK